MKKYKEYFLVGDGIKSKYIAVESDEAINIDSANKELNPSNHPDVKITHINKQKAELLLGLN